MEEPNVPELLSPARLDGQAIDMSKTTFFLSRETIVAGFRVGENDVRIAIQVKRFRIRR